ncbi:GNAT family N-acetyltransferase [Paractinoplanes toevensis]|uniref:GNAT family N-acetyltransferase n=1 Tax=Paractinoplanes toevensis TaxID=571911 RepID=UPI001BB3E283|nr:GNAT family N-acetyltransferase [Actinoplanes toevensis]
MRIETAVTEDAIGGIPAPEDQRFFLDRLQRGREYGRAYLALLGSDLVGCVYLQLDEAEEPELRALLPDTPLIQRLRVFGPHQRQGIGPMLVAAAEHGARAEDFGRIALGVDVDPRRRPGEQQIDLVRFYQNLGYREWPHGLVKTFDDDEQKDGSWVRRPGLCRIFTKHFRTT